MQRGKFIVFEGVDGAGTTTQTALFGVQLFNSDKSRHIVLTREPYDREKTKEIRKRLREETDPYSNAELMADLYIEGDRIPHLKKIILPLLNLGLDVISNRYLLSTISYQSAQGLDMDSLIERHKTLPFPDLTYFIDTPVKIAMQRSNKEEGKFENSKEFQTKVRKNYLEAIRRYRQKGEKIEIIDGEGSIEEVASRVWNRFKINFNP